MCIRDRVYPKQNDRGRLEVEILDAGGKRPVRLVFAPTGMLEVVNGRSVFDAAPYQPDQWLSCSISVDATHGKFSVSLDGKVVAEGYTFAEPAASVERLSFRTGLYRVPEPPQMNPQQGDERSDSGVYLSLIHISIPVPPRCRSPAAKVAAPIT